MLDAILLATWALACNTWIGLSTLCLVSVSEWVNEISSTLYFSLCSRLLDTLPDLCGSAAGGRQFHGEIFFERSHILVLICKSRHQWESSIICFVFQLRFCRTFDEWIRFTTCLARVLWLSSRVLCDQLINGYTVPFFVPVEEAKVVLMFVSLLLLILCLFGLRVIQDFLVNSAHKRRVIWWNDPFHLLVSFRVKLLFQVSDAII